MVYLITQALNGLFSAALLFLIAGGLTLVFGVMRIVNLSHGAYFLWGGYIALSVIHLTGSWALSLPVAALAVAAIGIAMERLFLRSEGFERLRTGVIALGIGVLISLAVIRATHFSWTYFIVGAAIGTIVVYALLQRM